MKMTLDNAGGLLAAALAVVALGVPRAALAEPTIDVSLGSEARWMTSSEMRAVSEASSQGLAAATAGLHLGRLLPMADVAVDLGIDGGSARSILFGRIGTETELLSLTASARAIRPIYGPLAAFARAGVGVRRLELTLEQDGRRARDYGWAPIALVGGGLDAVTTTRTSGMQFGVRVETGLVLDPGESFRADPVREDDDRIFMPSSSASLGRIGAGGFALRASLVARF